MKAIKLVSFDSTGTLIRVAGSIGKIYAEPLRKRGAPVTLDTEKVITRTFFDVFKRLDALSPNYGHGREGSRQWWRNLVQETYERTNVLSYVQSDMDRIGDEMFARFEDDDAWEQFSEVDAVLARIRSQGIKIMALSNFDERLHSIFKNKKLSPKFDYIVTSVDVGATKPNAEIFKRAQHIAGVSDPSTILHVGDDPIKDFVGASNAGWHALLLDRDGSIAEKHGSKYPNLIKDLNGVLHFLDRTK